MNENPVRTRGSRTTLWHNKDYLLLACGQTISNVGSEVSGLGYVLLILALTHSPAQVGFIGAVRLLPILLLSLPAGAIIDRWDRKRVMIWCDIVRACCLISIPIAFALGRLTIAQLYLTALVEATCAIFFDLAEATSLPRVVTREQLPAAMSQNQVIAYTSLMLGPTIGGALYSIGRFIPFLCDSLSYLFSIFSLFLIKTAFQLKRQTAPRSLIGEIKEGLSWLWRQQALRSIILLMGSLNLSVAGIDLIVVILAQRQNASPFLIGLVLAAGSIGGIGGAFIAPVVQKRLSYAQSTLGICWLTGLIWPLFALAPNIVVIAIVFTLYQIWGRIFTVVQLTHRAALTPDEMYGRVNGAAALLIRSGGPIGTVLTGLLIQYSGVTTTVLIITISRLLIASVATLNPTLRHMRPIAELKNG